MARRRRRMSLVLSKTARRRCRMFSIPSGTKMFFIRSKMHPKYFAPEFSKISKTPSTAEKWSSLQPSKVNPGRNPPEIDCACRRNGVKTIALKFRNGLRRGAIAKKGGGITEMPSQIISKTCFLPTPVR